MEIKATLTKPYAEKDRLDFVVTQNHQKGYVIKETQTSLEAWGLTPQEQTVREKTKQINVLKAQLSALDAKSARAVRAILAQTATDEDKSFLASLEVQAENLRNQIKELQGA